MGNSFVAVDARFTLVDGRGIAFPRPAYLHREIDELGIVAVPAFTGVRRLNRAPHTDGQLQTLGLVFLPRVDGIQEMVVELIGRCSRCRRADTSPCSSGFPGQPPAPC